MQRIASPPPEPHARPARFGRTIATFLIAASCAPALLAATKSLDTKPRPPVPLPAALDSQVRSARQVSKSVGVHVVDLDNGGTVYSWDADTPKIIASNTKLFTTAAALDGLGPDYSFETRLLINGKVENGVLEGDLAVVGGGDPNLSGRDHDGDPFAVFAPWAAALRERGIARIRGHLVLVHGLFDDAGVHPDWPRDQLTHWYEAPIQALSFSDNCVLVKVTPGRKVSAPPVVELVPNLPLFKVRNLARTTDSRRRHVVAVSRADQGDEITVSGYIWQKSGTLEAWVAVRDPVAYFGASLRSALELQGVVVEGSDEFQPALPVGGWEVVYDHHSALQRAIEVTNKRSQNFFAESLFKLLGAVRAQEGSWPGGVRAVGDFLDKVGIPRGAYSMADGSGLSRNNRFAPQPDHPAAGLHVPASQRPGLHALARLQRRGRAALGAPAGDAALSRQRLRQDRHAQRRLELVGLRQGEVGQGLRLLDPLQRHARRVASPAQHRIRIVRALIDNG